MKFSHSPRILLASLCTTLILLIVAKADSIDEDTAAVVLRTRLGALVLAGGTDGTTATSSSRTRASFHQGRSNNDHHRQLSGCELSDLSENSDMVDWAYTFLQEAVEFYYYGIPMDRDMLKQKCEDFGFDYFTATYYCGSTEMIVSNTPQCAFTSCSRAELEALLKEGQAETEGGCGDVSGITFSGLDNIGEESNSSPPRASLNGASSILIAFAAIASIALLM